MSSLVSKDSTLDKYVAEYGSKRQPGMHNKWACSWPTVTTILLGFGALFLMAQSFLTRQLDTKGCEMSYMWPSLIRFDDFDTEHTRFASKYSLHLYREGGIDDDSRVKGVPVLFIPGNAGSYKQVRSLGSEAAHYYHNVFKHDENAANAGLRPLDFFTVDFNEDFTAFHGQTLLDQAEYLNDAISFILSLYHTPSRSLRDSHLPDPTSVIIVGHSMGGIVARTMLTMPNYRPKSINTIVTLAAPHARPPVSFDGDIVRIYETINEYWRHSYSQKWAIDNPLWHITLVSIAGGGLDTIVPSDLANIASLVPETHGFTVFTSSIPNVWTGMDHLAITWCDQARKSIVRALYDVIDASRPTQTVPRAERMRGFKKWLLTGLEDNVEKTLPYTEPKTLLTVEEDSAIIPRGERLVLRNLGMNPQKPKAYLLPIPPQDAVKKDKFTLLTSEKPDSLGEYGKLEVLLCSPLSHQAGQTDPLFQMNLDLSGDSPGSKKLACKNVASDTVLLPASTRQSTFPFKKDQHPFSYLQYDASDLSGHQYVAVVDKATEHGNGWVIAQFSDSAQYEHKIDMGLGRLLMTGLDVKLPAGLMNDIKLPAAQSSLLAYNLEIKQKECTTSELFAPLVRQYITNVHESKFFVNVQHAKVNLHGITPYMPPSYFSKDPSNGLSLQIWTDPECGGDVRVSLDVDLLGSLGKLWMRYRIVFAAFPLLVVTLVLRQQFTVYDETGVFMSFAEGLNQCIKGSLPLTLAALTLLSIFSGKGHPHRFDDVASNTTTFSDAELFDNADYELLLGLQDSFFWFLIPLFGLMCAAMCIAVNYAITAIIYLLAITYGLLSPRSSRNEDKRRDGSFAVAPTRQRILTICILLSQVTTIIPYHFAYVVLCVVQLFACARSYHQAKNSRQTTPLNFSNYTHSLFLLMFWLLPINLPVLVVWIRNLTVHWLTPFSPHHNILSITPFVLLVVETHAAGRMIPRVTSAWRVVTKGVLFAFAAYAAVCGVTYAFVLHHVANALCAWLLVVHFGVLEQGLGVFGLRGGVGGRGERGVKKQP
ncbi:GPI inositol-deacylase [Periconia macrospinosa]|uniref:GPI inositol-deacylase n=1 Tax=Periconia macrospinosa TaxID=97972 RepID=A0A2V1DR09_9PLEO|nr:GPI inositol-deacylase [Periconia macrospinosa]